jgi:hypothetical protein
MDVKTSFLDSLIEKGVYINKPRGFEVHGHETNVFGLKEALYGLNQTPCWVSLKQLEIPIFNIFL